jgi:RimJ/RimL family protein N-acetyltransferase
MTAKEFSARIDKLGHRFQVGEVNQESCASLKEMYDGFSRTDLNQGLPPPDDKVRDQWIQTLLKSANNFLAWNHGKVIGHSSIIAEMQKRDAEFIIFISEPYRSRGIGTELTLLAVSKAKELGLSKIWLTVESFNFRAIGLYQKVGFRLSGEAERERVMVLKL